MSATPTTNLSFQNYFSATLTADLTASSTDVFLDTIPNGSEGFLVIDPDNATGHEVIYYNSKTGVKVVCPSVADGRGQDDTTASSHLTGTTVIMAPIAAYYEALQALFTTTPQGWTSLAGNFTSPTALGNRSYSVSTSVDQTAVLSPGMRFRSTRTVAAPTQCTSLNGTNQYYSKTTPAGMTFTDDFVVSAWVKLTAYGTYNTIVSRYNGTSGWQLAIDTVGRVVLQGNNAGSANFSYVTSNQSIPTNKWVHVAAQLDMSTFTASTTTSYVMIDGVDVPSAVTRGGTNPTALVQAGNLEVGSQNSGSSFFGGKIAQVAVYSARVTQATVLAALSQGLAGTETSLTSAYSFSNTLNDLNTTSANNLTAQNAAAATNADSPYGGQSGGTISSTLDYGIITKVTASIITLQVAEGCTIPTAGGITAAGYSTYKTPFGFPASQYKWSVSSIVMAVFSQGSAASGTWYNLGSHQLLIPVGEWVANYQSSPYISANNAGVLQQTLSTANNTESNPIFTSQQYYLGAITWITPRYRQQALTAASAVPYYLNLRQVNGTSATLQTADNTLGTPPAVIEAVSAYL